MYLDVPKIMFLVANLILYSEIMYMRSVKGNNQHAKIIGFLASNVIKLSPSYTGHYLVAEFRQFG